MAAPSDDTVRIGRPGSVAESLGEWCVRNGLATSEEIESCLKIQRAAETTGRPVPRLGEILVAHGILTHHQVNEALAAQKKEIRFCAQCGIQVNISVREDATLYRCGRCQGPLTSPAAPSQLHAVEEEFILESRDPLPPAVERALQDPSSRFGKYILLRQLGQGGIGVVNLAWDTYLSQFVALKRLRTARHANPQDTPSEHIHSLLKEARHAIRLRHPGIVSVFDVGRIGREYYVAMEYLEGETLGDRMAAARRNGRTTPFYEDPKGTLILLAEVARAVQYAHSRPSPIVHCDLKPANILVDPDGHPHVLDFGLARNLELDKPEKGEISGTPSYMAPEQASGDSDKIDQRTDVYAFGAILYEMLTGQPPFVGGTMEVLGKTIVDEPKRPSDTLRAGRKTGGADEISTHELLQIPAALEELCMSCLKKDRLHRPQTMDAVVAALELSVRPGHEKEEPVSPSPAPELPLPSLPERPRRVPRPATLVALAAGILLAGGALVLDREEKAPTLEAREAQILRLISKFRPDAAIPLADRLASAADGSAEEGRAARLVEESAWVGRLQRRALAAFCARPREVRELRLRYDRRGATWIAGADTTGLRIVDRAETETIPWENLEPRHLLDLLQSALGSPDEADLLGLAILALRCGLADEATLRFGHLRGTPLAPVAERYLASSAK
jgi:serine/threonine protein kinase